jgi:hypothetical protein
VPFGDFLATRSSSGAITPQSSLPDTRSLSGYDRVSLGVHGTLSIAGAVPLFGIVPDAIDWAYTAAELPFGKSTKTDLALATAGIAATAAPFIGDGAAAALKMSARVARIGGNTASDVVRVAGRFDDVGRVGKNAGVVPTNADDFVTVFRGDSPGTTVFKSHAAREYGYSGSKRLIDEGNLDDLFLAHAADSSRPPSPFISVTTDRRVAEFFAGQNGVVNEFRIPFSRATPNGFNNMVVPAGPGGSLIRESELLVPHYIRPSEFVNPLGRR